VNLPFLFLSSLEISLNRYLALDADTMSRLAAFAGKVIAIEVRGTGITLTMAPQGGGIQLLCDYRGTPDSVISGMPLTLARTGFDRDRGAVFAGEVEIRGDVALGQRFEAVLREIDIDWEEQLSRLMGDVAAHQIGRLLRDAVAWGAKSADSLSRDVSEYLQEESCQLPHRDEVDAFLEAVDILRDHVARLEARLNRLQAKNIFSDDA